MSDSLDTLRQSIKARIIINDKTGALRLIDEDRMVDCLTEFVDMAIEKFIKGQIEHGGDLAEVDLDKAMLEEMTDFFWYSNWKKYKKNKNSKT